MLAVSISLLIALRLSECTAYNYCGNHSPCVISGKSHFLCEMEKELTPYLNTSKFIVLLPETEELQYLFLKKHNQLRSILAKGNLTAKNGKAFESAKRMREVIWDTELAYLSRVHASLVADKHSQCHATSRFPNAGQNLGYMASSVKLGIRHIVNSSISAFFDEYLTAEDPDALIKKNEGGEQGHFTVVVSDRVSRIGCAIAAGDHCTKMGNDFVRFFITCHYDFTNIVGSYVYLTGAPVTGCEDWNSSPSDHYESLCVNTGKIFDANGKAVS